MLKIFAIEGLKIYVDHSAGVKFRDIACPEFFIGKKARGPAGCQGALQSSKLALCV